MKLLCLTLAGVDPETTDLLVKEGALPSLGARLAQAREWSLSWRFSRGYVADWLSLATGLPPWRHGVLLNALAKPASSGVAPATRHDLLAIPLWEALASEDFPTAAVGWPATQHSYGPNLDIYSDAFFTSAGSKDRFPVFAGSFYGRRAPRDYIALRKHADEFPSELHLNVREALARNYGKAAVAQRLFREGCQAVFLHLDLLEALGLPRDASQAMALTQYYELQDQMLAPVLEAAGEGAAVVVVFRPPSAAFTANRKEAERRGRLKISVQEGLPIPDIKVEVATDCFDYLAALLQRSACVDAPEATPAAKVMPDEALMAALEAQQFHRTLPLMVNQQAARDVLDKVQRLANSNYEDLAGA